MGELVAFLLSPENKGMVQGLCLRRERAVGEFCRLRVARTTMAADHGGCHRETAAATVVCHQEGGWVIQSEVWMGVLLFTR